MTSVKASALYFPASTFASTPSPDRACHPAEHPSLFSNAVFIACHSPGTTIPLSRTLLLLPSASSSVHWPVHIASQPPPPDPSPPSPQGWQTSLPWWVQRIAWLFLLTFPMGPSSQQHRQHGRPNYVSAWQKQSSLHSWRIVLRRGGCKMVQKQMFAREMEGKRKIPRTRMGWVWEGVFESDERREGLRLGPERRLGHHGKVCQEEQGRDRQPFRLSRRVGIPTFSPSSKQRLVFLVGVIEDLYIGDPESFERLKLLATLIAVKMRGQGREKNLNVEVEAFTDNKGNSFALKKALSTKFPLTLLVMELARTKERTTSRMKSLASSTWTSGSIWEEKTSNGKCWRN